MGAKRRRRFWGVPMVLVAAVTSVVVGWPSAHALAAPSAARPIVPSAVNHNGFSGYTVGESADVVSFMGAFSVAPLSCGGMAVGSGTIVEADLGGSGARVDFELNETCEGGTTVAYDSWVCVVQATRDQCSRHIAAFSGDILQMSFRAKPTPAGGTGLLARFTDVTTRLGGAVSESLRRGVGDVTGPLVAGLVDPLPRGPLVSVGTEQFRGLALGGVPVSTLPHVKSVAYHGGQPLVEVSGLSAGGSFKISWSR